ncbi:hypothetical protein QVD17_27807 [Tagetes erecta]|uniref:Uncharacterized protein n=1 Tax=Tagetes erecta TaxID=13708 RepID=A0AAD8KDX1_TARER|nr:hypothetical protein QVD17_27807 [Tagetes erecta]
MKIKNPRRLYGNNIWNARIDSSLNYLSSLAINSALNKQTNKQTLVTTQTIRLYLISLLQFSFYDLT